MKKGEVGIMARLTTHMNSQFEVMQHRMQHFVALSDDCIVCKSDQSGHDQNYYIVGECGSGNEKVIRTTVRMHMFGLDGEVHAIGDRVKNGSELFEIYCRIFDLKCVQCC